jgi:hypothetical protein
MIDGVMYYVSGWLKQGAKGPFLSLAFKRKDDQPVREQRTKPALRRADPISTGKQVRPIDDDMDGDSIPF